MSKRGEKVYKFFLEGNASHSFYIDSENKLWTFGSNDCGQLGIGDQKPRYKPTEISTKFLLPEKSSKTRPPTVKSFHTGLDHSLCLTEDMKVYATGSHYYGQLGFGKKRSTREKGFGYYNDLRFIEFEEVPLFKKMNLKIKYAHSGYLTSFFISVNDDVWCTGWNEHGQLALGDEGGKGIAEPKKIKGLKNDYVIDIQSGFDFVLFLTKEGDLYLSGSLQVIGSRHDLIQGNINLKESSFRSGVNVMCKLLKVPKCKKIVSSHCSFYAFSKTNVIYGSTNSVDFSLSYGNMYNKDFSLLGLEENKENKLKIAKNPIIKLTFVNELDVKDVAMSQYHCLILTKQSKVFALARGKRYNERCGFKQSKKIWNPRWTKLSGISQIAVGSCNSFVITNEGKLYAVGDNDGLGVGKMERAMYSSFLNNKIRTTKSENIKHSQNEFFLKVNTTRLMKYKVKLDLFQNSIKKKMEDRVYVNIIILTC